MSPTMSACWKGKGPLTSISCCFLASREALRALRPWEEAACESTTRLKSLRVKILRLRSEVKFWGVWGDCCKTID